MTPEQMNALRNLPYTCKPVSWPDVLKTVRAADLAAIAGDAVLTYTEAALWHTGRRDRPLRDFDCATPVVFIAETHAGRFLVNTEGYTYARYAARIVEPEPSAMTNTKPARDVDTYATFDTVPDYVVQEFADGAEMDAALKWSGKSAPPAIGARATIRFNNLGSGTVTGYFQEAGWLGVLVKLDNPPDWYRGQHRGNPPAHAFGAEIL